jgi:endonuclease YncB( thermonuclease family)
MRFSKILNNKLIFSSIFKHKRKNKVEEGHILKKLEKVDLKNCEVFVPKIKCGKVVKVYDGDTITIATILPNDNTIYKFSVRLAHVDAPEIRTKNKAEKYNAIFAAERLREKIMGKIIYLKNLKYEKFGRILGDIYLDSEDAYKDFYDNSINKWLLDNNYCVSYEGGKK